MLGDDDASRFILDDLRESGVDTAWATILPGGKSPTSYVISSQATGSRTIVHYRDLPEYPYEAFEKIDLSQFDWIHIEGREVSVCEAMLRHVRVAPQSLTVSVEIEKPRKNIEQLIPLADIVMISKAYALTHGYNSAQQLFDSVRSSSCFAMLFATWGEAGAWMQSGDGCVYHEPAYHPPAVIDTLGAGDVFNAGLIDGLLAGCEPKVALSKAVHLAGVKCGHRGLCIDRPSSYL
jgi:ketohexokinase